MARLGGKHGPMATTLASLRPLTGEAAEREPLVQRAADARYVLLGEATHGTHEFYRERARITHPDRAPL